MKQTGSQLAKKFPAFYGTRKFITGFTKVCPYSKQVHAPSHFLKTILILSSCVRLRLPNGLLPPGFPTKSLYAALLSPVRDTCPAHLILHLLV